MPRDYAKPVQKPTRVRHNMRPRSNPKTAPGWLWLVAGIAIGVVATTLFNTRELPEGMTPGALLSSTRDAAQDDQKPRFDFYTLLRDSEVIVPEVAATQQPALPTAEEYVFLLQTGSFKQLADADSLRAQLLMLNLTATVEAANTRPGETWYRVLVGPFDSNTNLAGARTILAENRIDSLLLKRLK